MSGLVTSTSSSAGAGRTSVFLAVRGDLDIYTALDLRAALVEALQQVERDAADALVVDLSDVPFVDSAGLGVLVGGYKAARSAGRDLALAGPSALVRMLLRTTGLQQVLEVLDEAPVAHPPV